MADEKKKVEPGPLTGSITLSKDTVNSLIKSHIENLYPVEVTSGGIDAYGQAILHIRIQPRKVDEPKPANTILNTDIDIS